MRLKKRAEPAQRKPPDQPPLVSEIPGLPKTGGPPEVANGAGPELLANDYQFVELTLDYGAFRWLWEIAESRAIQQWNHYHGQNVIEAPKAGRRAVEAIRNAAYKQYQPPEHTMPKKHRPWPPGQQKRATITGVKKLRRKGG